MALNGKRLGDLLLEADVLTKRQLQKALAMQASGDKRQIGEILIELKFITLDDLTEIMLTNGHDTTPPASPVHQPKSSKPVDISEDVIMKTKFALDVKTMIGAATGIASLVGMWYMLQADIQEAKELPSLESLYEAEYPSKPGGYNWPRSYEQYKDNVEGLQDEMDDVFGQIEELKEELEELQNDIKSLERRKRDK
jgi:hypothetical protein